MSEKLAKYIITTGKFDNESSNLRAAHKALREHAKKFPGHNFGVYKLVAESKRRAKR
jgi:hypothetical protein